MTKKDFQTIADAMAAVLTPMGQDNTTLATHYFGLLAKELNKRCPNMDMEKFRDTAAI